MVSLGFKLRFKSDMAKARVIINHVGEGGGGFLGRNIGFHEQIIKGKLQKIDCQLTVNDGGEHYGG